MKSKLKYLLIADNCIIDKNTGKLSLIGIFNDIKIPTNEQETIVSFVIAGRLSVEEPVPADNSGILKIIIYDPKDNVLVEKVARGQFDESKVVNFTIFFSFIKFTGIGKYQVRVYLNDTEVGSDVYSCNVNVK